VLRDLTKVEGEAHASVSRLLVDGRYDEAAEVMLSLGREYEHADEDVAAEMLDVAYRLCLTCSEQHAEVKTHRRAARIAARLEMRLREQLNAILDFATVGSLRSLQADRGPTPARTPIPPRGKRREEPRRPRRDPDGVSSRPRLAVHSLGPFRVHQDDRSLGPWHNRRAKAIFQYLVAHRARPVPKEILMHLFWPNASVSAARNNLNVAIYALRRFLRTEDANFLPVLFRADCYLLNPDWNLWVDFEHFDRLAASARRLERKGDHAGAVRHLQAAEALYQGSLFEDDPYEDWAIPLRRDLQEIYLAVLRRLGEYYTASGDLGACVMVCRRALTIEPYRESAHRELMRCYARQGQHDLALRQYHECTATLRAELEATPGEDTLAVYERIRRHETV
jgi:DNA-binding SARP family transcriptional activator